MKKRHVAAAAALLAALLVGWYVASPYVTLWRLRGAVEAEDEEALRALVDFPSVRSHLAEDLRGAVGPEIEEQLEDSPLAGVGRLLGDAAVEELVEAYVSPEGLFSLTRGRDPTAGVPPSGEPPELTIRRRGLGTFVASAETDVGPSPDFVFARRGLGWRMVRIDLGL